MNMLSSRRSPLDTRPRLGWPLLGAAALALVAACGGGSGPQGPPPGLTGAPAGGAPAPPRQIDWNAVTQWTEDLRQEFVKQQRLNYGTLKREVEPWFARRDQASAEAAAALDALREQMQRIEQHLGAFLDAELSRMPELRAQFQQARLGLFEASQAARQHFDG